mgnify:CR=1 FL=1
MSGPKETGYDKKCIYYELNTSVLEDVMLWIIDLKGTLDDEGNDKKI